MQGVEGVENNEYDGKNKNNKYDNKKNNINNKGTYALSECLWIIYIIILMMEGCWVYKLSDEKKIESKIIEYINKRKRSKVLGIIIILMMNVI